MAMQLQPTPPSPEMLEAMIRGEQDVIEGLVASDPIYNSYVRRFRAYRFGKPLGVKAFYSERHYLDQLYASTTPSLERRNPEAYASQCRQIYRLERELVAQ